MLATLLSDLTTFAASTFSGRVAIAFSLTILGAWAIGKLRAMVKARDAKRKEASPPSLPRELLLPVVHQDPDHMARADIVSEISGLVLEGDWSALASRIALWENRLEATPGGARAHDIAIDTCLAALQNLIDEAPRSTIDDLKGAEIAVEQMVATQKLFADNHILAVLAARGHMLIAETCAADFWPENERKEAWRRMAHHYLAAESILTPFDPVSHMSPLLAGCFYRLALGMPDGDARIRPAFEDWIDLDPSDPAIYATHVKTILPTAHGSIAELIREADRAERRTSETLGQGGYALFMVPVLEEDDSLREEVEPDRLAAGLMDLARMSGTQAEVNWAAACLARESAFGTPGRRQIMLSAFDGLVRRNLGVIYPRLWDMPLNEIRSKLKDVFESTPADADVGDDDLDGAIDAVRAA